MLHREKNVSNMILIFRYPMMHISHLVDHSFAFSFSDDFPVPLNRTTFLLQGLEATLSDSKKKYADKVSALLSAWEHVTNYIPAAPPEAIQSLIEWAHRWVHVVRRSLLLHPWLCSRADQWELVSRRHVRVASKLSLLLGYVSEGISNYSISEKKQI